MVSSIVPYLRLCIVIVERDDCSCAVLLFLFQLHRCPHDGCDYACPGKSALQTHMQKHIIAKPFTCHICGKDFKRAMYVASSWLMYFFPVAAAFIDAEIFLL